MVEVEVPEDQFVVVPGEKVSGASRGAHLKSFRSTIYIKQSQRPFAFAWGVVL
jgi:hypothetical protein